MTLARFFFGAIIGSFLDVVASRYDPDKFLFARQGIGGRSRCVSCGTVLRWFELIPLVSFIVQRGRCRTCKKRIAREHFFVEIISGLIVAYAPLAVKASAAYWYEPRYLWLAESLWTVVLLILFLIALIDARLQLIPDEANILLAVAGIALTFLGRASFGPGAGSFLGHYAYLFEFRDGILINRVVGAGVALVLFGFLVLVTKGRGMGVGDVKLAAVLGIVFGWPDALISFALAFIVGSLFGLWHIFLRKGGLPADARWQAGMKSAVPFGPFLALGAALVFFFGEPLMRWYFSFIPL